MRDMLVVYRTIINTRVFNHRKCNGMFRYFLSTVNFIPLAIARCMWCVGKGVPLVQPYAVLKQHVSIFALSRWGVGTKLMPCPCCPCSKSWLKALPCWSNLLNYLCGGYAILNIRYPLCTLQNLRSKCRHLIQITCLKIATEHNQRDGQRIAQIAHRPSVYF